jgi:RNA polymerase sigma-B factor
VTVERPADLGELFREYRRTGSRRIRNQIVEAHLDIPDYYVRRFAGKGVAADDLRQTALLAMLRAVDRYDPDLGVEFSTFAGRTIDGELKRYFRDRTWAVRPPRRTQELHLHLRRAGEELTHELGRAPTVRELADAVDETVDHVLEALEAGVAHRANSLDQPAGDDDGQAPAERLLVSDDVGYERIDRRLVVGELLDLLDDREREIIALRFFEGMSQPEIAERIGVSQSYLSRLLRKALLRLRDVLPEDLGEVED